MHFTNLHFRESGKGSNLWVLCMRPNDSLHVGGRVVQADEDFLKAVASETRRALYAYERYAPEGSKPFRMPLLLEHKRSGGRYGDILDLKVSGEGDRYGLYVLVAPHDDIRAGIQAGRIQHVSVGISGSYTDENGETYSPYLSELSLVASPHLKSLTPIQQTLSLQLSESACAEIEQLSEAQKMELAEQLTDLLVRVRALEEALAAPEPQEGETSEATEEDTSEPVEAPEAIEASEDTGDDSEPAQDADTDDVEDEPEGEGLELGEVEPSEEASEPVETPSLLTLSEADLRELIASAVQDALPARPAPPVRLARGADKPSPPQRLELSEWIEKTASERGISKSEAARLSMTEFND